MAKKKTAARVAKTVSAAAEQLGVGERTLAAWLARGCPGAKDRYDLDAIEAWRAENVKPQPRATDSSGRAKWEERRARAEALLKELRVREARGELIGVARAGQIVRQHIAEVVTHLDQLPDFAVAGQRLATDAKKKIRERLKAKIRELRATLEKSLREMARAAKRDGEVESDE